MKIFFILNYFIIYLLCFKKSIQSYIVYPFKKSTKVNKTYPENLLQNDLEIALEIGTPSQRVGLNLRSQVYAFSITSSEVNLPYPTFDENKSKSLTKLDNLTNYKKEEFAIGYPICESIIINKKEVKNISLVLATSITYNQTGVLGLRPFKIDESEGYLSFIYQMKKKANLDNYAFTLRYEDDEKGELIIGSYPHLYDKKYDEKNFYYSRIETIEENIEWVIDFDEIKYDNIEIPSSTSSPINRCLFKIDYGLILAPLKLKDYLRRKFLNQCYQKEYKKRNITIFHCDKTLNITNFKNLSFILKDIDYEFILTYKDLFIERDDEYIFSIAFDTYILNKNPMWIFGKPFMKKYHLIFDMDRKIIGLYKENTTNNINGIKENNKQNYIIYIILIIILALIVIALFAYIIYYIKVSKRNKAQELVDDNLDYIPAE